MKAFLAYTIYKLNNMKTNNIQENSNFYKKEDWRYLHSVIIILALMFLAEVLYGHNKPGLVKKNSLSIFGTKAHELTNYSVKRMFHNKIQSSNKSNYTNIDKCIGLGIYKFGTLKNQYSELDLEIEEGDVRLYTAKIDEIKIKDVKFEYIRITFIKNKLSGISLSTKNSTGIVFFNHLTTNYGTPLKRKNSQEWVGKNVKIIFDMYKNSKDASIDFYFKTK